VDVLWSSGTPPSVRARCARRAARSRRWAGLGKCDQHIGDVCGVVAGPVWQPQEAGEFAGEFARRALGRGGDIDDGDSVTARVRVAFADPSLKGSAQPRPARGRRHPSGPDEAFTTNGLATSSRAERPQWARWQASVVAERCSPDPEANPPLRVTWSQALPARRGPRHARGNQRSNAEQHLNFGGMRIGIDFGTTHTVAAVVDRGNYAVVSFDGVDTWPSLVAANAAGELRFGLDAVAVRHEAGWSVLRSFKSLLNDAGPRTEVDLGGRCYRLASRRASASRPRSACRPTPQAPSAL
jgi:hypothetical protein